MSSKDIKLTPELAATDSVTKVPVIAQDENGTPILRADTFAKILSQGATRVDNLASDARVPVIQDGELVLVPASAFGGGSGGSATLPLTEEEWANLYGGGCAYVVNGVPNSVNLYAPLYAGYSPQLILFSAVYPIQYGVWSGAGTLRYDAAGKRYILEFDAGCGITYTAEKTDGASPVGTYTVIETSDASLHPIGTQYQVYPEGVCP